MQLEVKSDLKLLSQFHLFAAFNSLGLSLAHESHIKTASS